jgi:hypothetical protein
LLAASHEMGRDADRDVGNRQRRDSRRLGRNGAVSRHRRVTASTGGATPRQRLPEFEPPHRTARKVAAKQAIFDRQGILRQLFISQPIRDGLLAQADGVGERLRRPRLSNVAAARPMDEMPVEEASEAPPGATGVEYFRSLSSVSDEQQTISGRPRHYPPRQGLQTGESPALRRMAPCPHNVA